MEKSEKWTRLNRLFLDRAEQLKESFYTNMVDDLKTYNFGQWYSKIKRMSTMDPTNNEKICVEELENLSSKNKLIDLQKFLTYMFL